MPLFTYYLLLNNFIILNKSSILCIAAKFTVNTNINFISLRKNWSLKYGFPLYLKTYSGCLCIYTTWRTIIFLIFVYSNSLHVSSNQVLIIRRVNCINTTSGIYGIWPCGMQAKPAYHTVIYRIYQWSYWYNWLSWWWALGCSKHVENWNKQI